MARRARRRLEYLPAALGDLKRLQHDDPALAREAGRILTDFAAGRRDGEPLSAMAATGDLSDCRKIYFGHRNEPTHRIVLQLRPDGTIEVVLVVAVESRADAYVYLLAPSAFSGCRPSSSRTWIGSVRGVSLNVVVAEASDPGPNLSPCPGGVTPTSASGPPPRHRRALHVPQRATPLREALEHLLAS